MNTQQTIKNKVRQQIAELRTEFQPLEKKSKAVVKTFQGLELFQQAKTVGVYMPLPDEVDITPLFGFGSLGELALPTQIDTSGRANSPSEPLTLPEKTFYIPAFDEAVGAYRLAEYTSELKKGKFGIPEPAIPVFAPQELDLIIVPGIAFDHTGHRIGRGGGFYDRLLPHYHAVKVGVCFDFQTLDSVPREPHDCTIDWLVTESKILEFAMNC